MDGRAFLDAARHLLAAPNEPNLRIAAGAVYLAVLEEARAALERWGFRSRARANIYNFVRSRFGSGPNMDLLRVEDVLRRTRDLQQEAFNAIAQVGKFADSKRVTEMLSLAEVGIDLLYQIDADPARRAGAVAAIRDAFP